MFCTFGSKFLSEDHVHGVILCGPCKRALVYSARSSIDISIFMLNLSVWLVPRAVLPYVSHNLLLQLDRIPGLARFRAVHLFAVSMSVTQTQVLALRRSCVDAGPRSCSCVDAGPRSCLDVKCEKFWV